VIPSIPDKRANGSRERAPDDSSASAIGSMRRGGCCFGAVVTASLTNCTLVVMGSGVRRDDARRTHLLWLTTLTMAPFGSLTKNRRTPMAHRSGDIRSNSLAAESRA